MVKHLTKKMLLLPLFLLFLSLFFVYIYQSVLQTQKNIFQKIENNKIQEYAYIFQNFNDYLINFHHVKTKEDLLHLLADKNNQEVCYNIMSVMNTKDTKYLYILQKDKDNRFRFLLDASKEDKANFYQKFDVQNPQYQTIYETKQAQIITQKDIETLYSTYLYPLMAGDEIIAIVSVDININITYEIADLVQPLALFFKILIVAIFVAAAMVITQIFYYFSSQKRIFTDPLTKLFNRNYLYEIAPSLNLHNYGLAMLDLDKFKNVNDTYGHKAGDLVLTEASQIFKKSIRDNDILIRFGGEEFLVFLHDRGNKKSTIEICERIRKNIENDTFVYENQKIPVTVSIGLNMHPSRDKSLTDAIKKADELLYQAKENGRNRVIF